jgi:replication factor C subunit 3/5
VAVHDWEIYLNDTAKMIVMEQSPQKLLQIRSRLYELMIHGIPSEVIFKVRFLDVLAILAILRVCMMNMEPEVFIALSTRVPLDSAPS